MPEPTVQFDVATRTIYLTVIVSNSTPNVLAPPCDVPKGRWTLVWTLQPDTAEIKVSFGHVNLYAYPHPPGVTIIDSALSGNEWRAEIDNQVMDVNKFDYKIATHVDSGSEDVKTYMTIPPHDPTIAVTSEPIDG
jgi:hypothetical protein